MHHTSLVVRGVAFVVVMVLASGCYTTKVVSGPGQLSGRMPEHEDRQFFTIGGLVPLSQAAGKECHRGLAEAKSSLAVTDILINIGIGAAGALAGAMLCNTSESASYSCASTGMTLAPFLLGTRTVSYTCLDEGPITSPFPSAPLPPPSLPLPQAQ